MAILNLRKGQAGLKPNNLSDKGMIKLEKIIDFSKAENTITVGTTVELFDIPKNMRVDSVFYEITTVEDGTLTFTIGDTTSLDVDAYFAAVNAENLGAACSQFSGVNSATAGTAQQCGKLYSAADIISMTTSAGANTLVIRVVVLGRDFTA